MRLPFILIVVVVLASPAWGQEEFPHPELAWKTIETEHFLVHFHTGTERTAQEVARVAEQIYGPVTELYQHKPNQKVSFVIKDHDDYSNGAAYFYDNRIEIWAPSLDFELRGTHPWIENVVTHEFTHIVQIQTTMKLGRTVPAVYFQWLGYESERRPDVLYGFPNVIVSYPLSAFVVPAWFAEGVAQFNHPDLQYDRYDSHRRMILRTAALDGNMLSWEDMAVFGKTSLGNEQSYNAGYAFIHYIAQKYGVEKLQEISRKLGSLHRVTISGAIEAALGISGEALYDEWKQSMLEFSQNTLRSIGEPLQGEIVEDDGFGNFYPAFTPDGKKLAYVSTKDKDYFSSSSVYLYDL
ncbi:MAG TPA: biopolymer transporter Tol, partial [Bacteroidota bacterium]